jgi:hypothetical protein
VTGLDRRAEVEILEVQPSLEAGSFTTEQVFARSDLGPAGSGVVERR